MALKKDTTMQRTNQDRRFLPIIPCLLSFILGTMTHRSMMSTTTIPIKQDCIVQDNSNNNDTDNKYDNTRNNQFPLPLGRSEAAVEYLPGHPVDVYTPFHDYLNKMGQESNNPPVDFGVPLLHIWPLYFEAYHNHWYRYIGKEVVFMEVGVQSGGKIPLLRQYFGDKFTYIGIDINESCRMFDNGDWVHIEIGDSADPEFWKQIKEKYPKVDLFLDDGGHRMLQQKIALKEMFPHIQPNGVYMCEDLSTSWGPQFGGIANADVRNPKFLDTTMVGLIHQIMDWLNYQWITGTVMTPTPPPDDFWPQDWWRSFATNVKHIHYYNQIVVFEKGTLELPFHTKTVGPSMSYKYSGVHPKVVWPPILQQLGDRLKWNIE